MWISDRGGFDTVAVDDPAAYFSSDLRAQIDRMTDEEKVRLDLAIAEGIPPTYSRLGSFDGGDENEFTMTPPPTSLMFAPAEPEETVLESLSRQLEAVPLRWRLDMFEVVGSYIATYGPPFRRWKKLAKKLNSESSAKAT